MKLPSNWKQITIAQFQQLQKLTEANLESQIKTLAILSGQSEEDIEEMKISEVTRQLSRLAWMEELPTVKEYSSCRIGFKRYKFAANKSQITAGQFITVQDLFNAGNWVDNLHQIMAAMLVGKHDFEKTAELFRKRMPISVAYGYTLFFSAYYPELLQITQAYLEGVKAAAMMYVSENVQA